VSAVVREIRQHSRFAEPGLKTTANLANALANLDMANA
jgi:hypothetical protein